MYTPSPCSCGDCAICLRHVVARLRAALAAAQRERDEARAQLHGCRAQLKEWDQDIGKVQAECDALRAEVERLRNENQTAWNKASVLDEDLRHLRAVIAPTDENIPLYDKAMRSKFHSSRPGDMARAVLAAIAARAGKP